MLPNVIKATILNGKSKERVCWYYAFLLFPLTCLWFQTTAVFIPLALSIIINKAQSQSLKVFGLNIENPCFLYGQLYVTFSQVRHMKMYLFLLKTEKAKILYILKYLNKIHLLTAY